MEAPDVAGDEAAAAASASLPDTEAAEQEPVVEDVVDEPDATTAAEAAATAATEIRPPPPAPYALDSGDALTYSYVGEGPSLKKRLVWLAPSVANVDEDALVAFVEVDGGHREFSIAAAAAGMEITGPFAAFFNEGNVLRPLHSGRVVRLCLCATHRQLSMLSAMDDILITCAALSAAAAWQIVVENGDGFVRFFGVTRTRECLCKVPVLFSP